MILIKKTGINLINKIILAVLFFPLFMINAYAVTSTTEHGSLQIDREIYEISNDKQTMMKISGMINNTHTGGRLTLVVILPDGLTNGLNTIPTKDGYFETFWILDDQTQLGQYKLFATYESVSLGDVTFEVKEKVFSAEDIMTARQMLDSKNQSKTISEPVEKLQSSYQTKSFESTDTGKIIVTSALGSGAPGCETTAEGCYIPKEATVDVGGKVIFSNTDTAAHTVTSGTPDGMDGIFDSGLFMAGSTFEFTFDKSGTYPYFCMVHPWMTGVIFVGNSPYSLESVEKKITVDIDDYSIFYPDKKNNTIRGTVEITNYSPSDGDYFMKITHISTKKIIKDLKIYPKSSVNNMWIAPIEYSILDSDILVGGKPLLGSYEIQISSEYDAQTATTKFSILELKSSLDSKTDSVVFKPVPKTVQSTPKVEKQSNPIISPKVTPKNNSSDENYTNVMNLVVVLVVISIAVITVIIIIKIKNNIKSNSITHDDYDVEEDEPRKRIDWE